MVKCLGYFYNHGITHILLLTSIERKCYFSTITAAGLGTNLGFPLLCPRRFQSLYQFTLTVEGLLCFLVRFGSAKWS